MTTENYADIKEKGNNKIVVIDDEKDFARTVEWEIEEAGYEPFSIVDVSFQKIDELISRIPEDTYAVLCDHRLSKSGISDFYGSDLVATLYDRKIPALLDTQFYDMDNDVSIRKCRHKIPVLLNKDNVSASTIKEGIKFCLLELNGTFSTNRKSYRNIVRIVDISKESREDVVDVIIPSWNPNKAVRLPSSLIREWILEFEPVIGNRLIANVNSGAKNPEDLYFTNFEIAPSPEAN
ncbi:hypothetical protein [Pseudanabaena sp. BC1403]|uniref:hypothetical protein n=1 Tax=Pseudanabaena sp. BC1403 TaxID=2043171 RepID=UPI000CD9DE05|nr:hypothetical protein [Pseudanabaena sp. BC1403]